jgi:hypothetical protein
VSLNISICRGFEILKCLWSFTNEINEFCWGRHVVIAFAGADKSCCFEVIMKLIAIQILAF